jgi:hypothetical protein
LRPTNATSTTWRIILTRLFSTDLTSHQSIPQHLPILRKFPITLPSRQIPTSAHRIFTKILHGTFAHVEQLANYEARLADDITDSQAEGARALYESLGFKAEGCYRDGYRDDDGTYENLIPYGILESEYRP